MLVREIRAFIMCPECGEGFDYSAMSVHTTLEGAYKFYIKYHLNMCVHCHKAKLIVRDMSCKLVLKKIAYDIRWQCNKCFGIWTQSEYLNKEELSSENLISRFKQSVICPNLSCGSSNKTFLSISKSIY